MSNPIKPLLIALVISGMSSIAILGINIYKGQSSRIEQETEAPSTVVKVQYKTLDVFYAKSAVTLQTVVHCPTGKTFTVSNRGGMVDLGVKTECNTGP